MKKLLWIGDAVAATGFARGTHYILNTLRHFFDVEVLGLNYLGDPHKYPYPIYPASIGGDFFGVRRVKDIIDKVRPDVVVIMNDPWNFPPYMKQIRKAAENVPVIGIVAVDGYNVPGKDLAGIDHAIFWTAFGQKQCEEGGWEGESTVIPLGVDRSIYYPMDRLKARKLLFPKSDDPKKDLSHLWNAFILGNVARNQPRKRLDLNLQLFADWVKKKNINDAYVMLHVAETSHDSYDLNQLALYYGLKGRFIYSATGTTHGVDEDELNVLYNSMDVLWSNTQGEGMGLPQLEAMACGKIVVAPRWSALAEWAEPAACLIDCDHTVTSANGINTIGGVPSRAHTLTTLDDIYRSETMRKQLQEASLKLAADPRFDWNTIGQRVSMVVHGVFDEVGRRQGNASSLSELSAAVS